ncbi:MAG TPA: hypothetical protein VL966_05270 [Alphaproteobacteria bacterium]|jgi:hypothetical protein|nr:hypothetical protein [Alphaproteobacteria bacterium]
MILFEIHIFRDQAWKVDSVFDDKELAVYEAQRIEKTARFSAVRVIEEIYDETTQRTKTRTVYRSSKIDKENLESHRRRAQAATFEPPPRRRAAKTKHASPTLLVFNLIVVVLGGFTALFLLRYLWERG